MRKRFLALLVPLLLALASPALAQQAILQAGAWTSGHSLTYVPGGAFGQPIVQDSGPAGGGSVGLGQSEQLLVVPSATQTYPSANGGTGPLGTNWCDYDAPVTNSSGYHWLCLSPNAQGGGLLAFGAGGGAGILPLYAEVNGTKYQFPFAISGIAGPSTTVIGDFATWANTNGTLLADLSHVDNGVVSTTSGGAAQISTTLPSGITAPALTVTGSFTASGLVSNADLANDTISGIALGQNLDTLTFGTHLAAGGSSYNGSAGVTIATDATNADTDSTIVARDGSGNFSAGTITASLTGGASLDCALAGCTMTGALDESATTASSSTSTGAIIDAGGLGVAGAEYVGGLENVAGVLTAAATTASTSTTTGGLVDDGGLGVAGAIYGGGVIVTGSSVIGSLPTCNSGTEGARYFVTNGVSTPTFAAAVSTTGSTVDPVFCTGSSWVYG